MSQRTYAFRKFVVVRDTEPDREPTCFAMQCAVCEEAGPLVESAKSSDPQGQLRADEEAKRQAAQWVPVHRREQPEHLSHRLIRTTPYRLVPGEWE
ncbi:hypothetical protein MTQ01_04920 [Streptomyces sp. XM4193]|uniref:DUF7848 domain-containing protein n=1 Tax=Streptomyces sp. XM4193 TaxID=2929782 RepID=UPI001FF8EAB6|nr:hypothetical protein [Streptomyces sp. XM4193]MCK1795360.1 hypothetical protein [Streptomyces sp. XM4193]